MQKHTYRTILIYAVIVVALVQVYPTVGWMLLTPERRQDRQDLWDQEDALYHEPAILADVGRAVRRWAQFDRNQVITLGLDLQGGVHMVLGLDPSEEQKERGFDVKATQQLVLQTIRRRISDFEAKEPIVQALGEDQIQIQLPGEKNIKRARDLITRTAHLTFHIVAGPQDETPAVIRAIRDAFPGRFTPFLLPPGPGESFFRVPPDHIEKVRNVAEEASQHEGLIPEGKIIAFSQPPNPWDDYQGYYIYVMDRQELITGEGLRMAKATPDDESPGNWQILFQFSGRDAITFADVTDAHVDEHMAIVLDGVVCSAPVIRTKIAGVGAISGAFSAEQATDLAIALNSGSMPVRLREDYTGVVGASLGADSVRRGVRSSLAGMVIVGLFMLFYYRIAGVIANIALGLNAILVLAALAYFDATLTLPGIAGLILTVGMAVDANVLIFERIREELRLGKSLAASIESGYARATVTILDANVTTLIAAAVLSQFGTGPIEGFAVTLSIGVCSSVFTALVVTRAILDFLTAREKLSELTMMSLIKPDTKFQFLAKRRFAFTASAAAIVVGIIMFGIRGRDNYGVDFTNGTNMIVQLDVDEPVDVGAVRDSLIAAGFESPIVQEYAEGADAESNHFVIRIAARPDEESAEETPAVEGPAGDTGEAGDAADDAGGNAAGGNTEEALPTPTPEEATGAAAEADEEAAEEAAAAQATAIAAREATSTAIFDQVQEALAGLVAGDASRITAIKEETVGPAVGKELRKDALLAISYALIFIVAYLWFRFELRFAVAAAIALVHDVLVTVGIFAVWGTIFGGRQITMPVIAALLTIIGYSLNDTIVVFDRIREDMRLYRGRAMPFTEILDLSINQTLGRTLLTSLTTLFVVVVLFIFGGSAINDFAFGLIVGVLVGTYSSIFVACPVVYLWQKLQGRHIAPTATGRSEGPEGKGKRKKKRGAAKATEATA